jgi:hypothetical protein
MNLDAFTNQMKFHKPLPFLLTESKNPYLLWSFSIKANVVSKGVGDMH